MKTMLFSTLLVVCFGAIAPNAYSQDTSGSQTNNNSAEPTKYVLSLEDAKELALESNWDRKNAGLAVEKAYAAKWEAISAALPQISATVDYTNFMGASNSLDLGGGATSTIEFNPTSSFNGTASMFFSGTYLVGVQLSKMSVELSEMSIEKSDLDVKQLVADAYFSILLSEKSKEIIVQNIDNIKDVYNQTEMMYKAGTAELTDVDQISIQLTLLESQLRTVDRQIAIAYDALKLQIGIDPYSEVELTQKLMDFYSPDNFYASLLKIYNSGENIDYRLMEQQESMAKKQVTLAKMEYVPTLSAAYNRLEQIMAPNFNMSPKNTIALTLTVPIFSSGQRKAKVDQARIDYETTQNTKEQLNDALIVQDRQIKLNLRTALDQYDAQKENVDVAKRVYDNTNRKYENGLVSSLDLTTANTNYLNAESSYIQSMLEVLQAYVELEKFYNTI